MGGIHFFKTGAPQTAGHSKYNIKTFICTEVQYVIYDTTKIIKATCYVSLACQ